jgi:hypothetical protein
MTPVCLSRSYRALKGTGVTRASAVVSGPVACLAEKCSELISVDAPLQRGHHALLSAK